MPGISVTLMFGGPGARRRPAVPAAGRRSHLPITLDHFDFEAPFLGGDRSGFGASGPAFFARCSPAAGACFFAMLTPFRSDRKRKDVKITAAPDAKAGG